jgi:glycogen(starch) synthase
MVRAFDALMVPSVSPDPCPRVVIEAMALGTPVIGTDHGGIPEVIEHEASGLLVPPGDSGALAAAVVRLMDDDLLRRRIIEEADRKVRRDHDADGVAERIQAHIVEAVGTGKKPG